MDSAWRIFRNQVRGALAMLGLAEFLGRRRGNYFA